MSKIIIFLTLLFVMSSTNIFGQHDDDPDHVHTHDHHDLNEIGIAIGAAYILDEDEFAPSFHIHYTRMLEGKWEKIGFGVGFESVMDEHRHYTVALVINYRPVHAWWISLGPGITYFESENEVKPSLHVETGYEFDVGKVHLGPLVEYAFTSGDQHFMLGLHVGFPF